MINGDREDNDDCDDNDADSDDDDDDDDRDVTWDKCGVFFPLLSLHDGAVQPTILSTTNTLTVTIILVFTIDLAPVGFSLLIHAFIRGIQSSCGASKCKS